MSRSHLRCALFLLLLITARSTAQNLISNGGFQSGNSGFESDYIYSPGDMIPGGTYCVVDNPGAVHFAWSSFGDHTTGNGLMLVVNGDVVGVNNTVWRETILVTPGRSYQFSFWAASSHDDTPAQFAVRVNGQRVLTTPPLPSTTGSWQQFQTLWSSGTSTTGQIEIVLANTVVGATDFVLDDMAFVALPALTIQPAVQLSWQSTSNVSYQVQWSTNLAPTQWFNFGGPITGNGGTNTVSDPVGFNPGRFYRVVPLD